MSLLFLYYFCILFFFYPVFPLDKIVVKGCTNTNGRRINNEQQTVEKQKIAKASRGYIIIVQGLRVTIAASTMDIFWKLLAILQLTHDILVQGIGSKFS